MLSLAVGAVTGDPLLEGVIGGDILGGFAGATITPKDSSCGSHDSGESDGGNCDGGGGGD